MCVGVWGCGGGGERRTWGRREERWGGEGGGNKTGGGGEEIKHTSISTLDQISESDGSAAVGTGDQGITVTEGGERDDGGWRYGENRVGRG